MRRNLSSTGQSQRRCRKRIQLCLVRRAVRWVGCLGGKLKRNLNILRGNFEAWNGVRVNAGQRSEWRVFRSICVLSHSFRVALNSAKLKYKLRSSIREVAHGRFARYLVSPACQITRQPLSPSDTRSPWNDRILFQGCPWFLHNSCTYLEVNFCCFPDKTLQHRPERFSITHVLKVSLTGIALKASYLRQRKRRLGVVFVISVTGEAVSRRKTRHREISRLSGQKQPRRSFVLLTVACKTNSEVRGIFRARIFVSCARPSPDNFNLMEWGRLRWPEHVARMGDTKQIYSRKT